MSEQKIETTFDYTVKINSSCSTYVRNRAKKERIEQQIVNAIDEIREFRANQRTETKENRGRKNIWRAA